MSSVDWCRAQETLMGALTARLRRSAAVERRCEYRACEGDARAVPGCAHQRGNQQAGVGGVRRPQVGGAGDQIGELAKSVRDVVPVRQTNKQVQDVREAGPGGRPRR
jgi:hypothetical protein